MVVVSKRVRRGAGGIIRGSFGELRRGLSGGGVMHQAAAEAAAAGAGARRVLADRVLFIDVSTPSISDLFLWTGVSYNDSIV